MLLFRSATYTSHIINFPDLPCLQLPRAHYRSQNIHTKYTVSTYMYIHCKCHTFIFPHTNSASTPGPAHYHPNYSYCQHKSPAYSMRRRTKRSSVQWNVSRVHVVVYIGLPMFYIMYVHTHNSKENCIHLVCHVQHEQLMISGSAGRRQCGLVQIIEIRVLHGYLSRHALARIVNEHFLKWDPRASNAYSSLIPKPPTIHVLIIYSMHKPGEWC